MPQGVRFRSPPSLQRSHSPNLTPRRPRRVRDNWTSARSIYLPAWHCGPQTSVSARDSSLHQFRDPRRQGSALDCLCGDERSLLPFIWSIDGLVMYQSMIWHPSFGSLNRQSAASGDLSWNSYLQALPRAHGSSGQHVAEARIQPSKSDITKV